MGGKNMPGERPCERAVCGWIALGACLLLATLSSCGGPSAAPEPAGGGGAAIAALPSAAEEQAIGALLDAMLRRLEIMHDVAKWKWNRRQAIDDPERERRLLDELERRGRQLQLPPAETRRLMQAQIDAGKLIQRADCEAWRLDEREPFSDVPGLQSELRPKIDRASEELLSAYAALRERLAEAEFRELVRDRAEHVLKEAGIETPVRVAALQGWLHTAEDSEAPLEAR